MRYQPPRYAPLGDQALMVELGDEIDPDINRAVLHLHRLIQAKGIVGVVETIPAYCSLVFCLEDLSPLDDGLRAWITAAAGQSWDLASGDLAPVIEIPVLYGGVYGPDMERVMAHTGLAAAEVVERHTAREYRVYMIGFTMGFAYLGGMDPLLATPRLLTPRTRVPAGTVGIGGVQTGVYSVDSPGGWNLIGWADQVFFDLSRPEPFLLHPGDRVRFRQV